MSGEGPGAGVGVGGGGWGRGGGVGRGGGGGVPVELMFEPWDRHENMIPVQGPFGFRPLLANSSRSGCCHIDNHIESNQSMNLPSIYLCECSYLNLLTYRWIHIS